MWIASWMVCILNIGCQEVAEPTPTLFFKEEDCNLFAYEKAAVAQKNLQAQGYSAQVAFTCTESKNLKQG